MKAVKVGSAVFGACMVLSGCSTPTTYDSAFSEKNRVKGNSESISAPIDIVWGSVVEVMADLGWILQQADASSHVILAHKEIRDENNKDLSHSLTATVTLVSTSKQITRVIAAANITSELHESSHTWWHLLWLIPIFPTGTEYTTVVVNRDAVQSAQLYRDFFACVAKRCDEKKELQSLPPPEASAVPSPQNVSE